ncbi:MAG TPA: hypothetical protein PKZ99_08955, partial [Azospirillaceae bacterium]|nr:hypothetical protein [Azospirillaceae bacterium]
SADQAGRRFPLVLLIRYLSYRRPGFTSSPMSLFMGEPASNDGAPASPDVFPSEDPVFAVLEAAARDASAGVSPTDRLHGRLEADVAAFSAAPPSERESVWRGYARTPDARSPGGLSGLGMPPPAAFAGMLTGDWSAFDPTPFKVTP